MTGINDRLPSARVTASTHENGVVLLHTGTGVLFEANRTGSRIWQGLERHVPIDEIAADISRTYGITQATALEHTGRFLADLERHGLIERSARR